MKKLVPVLFILALTTGFHSITEARLQLQETAGIYQAVIRPMNIAVTNTFAYGVADIEITDTNIEVKSWLNDASQTMHRQNIYMGSRCPTLSDDVNQDGVIDEQEMKQVAEQIIIPLDLDLSTQKAKSYKYPKGNYGYYQKVPLQNFLADLEMKDENPYDNFTKLKKGEPLNLAGKILIIQGTETDSRLPIACAVIERISPITASR